ncbi:MAG: tRNA (N6-isopentenyl adenosine(37)-C2)-methylthiotransferase MiaB [Bacteroidales bacterium]|nr:tRNA (N6-isopentenyl adenosine(37)-C2)-methylthiotransferase MiaB [Porphyromonas sp.]MDD6934498.1 tRNA (N6-isopentenyl adenosine(37)-C2)-methylthiotransferase MiaB [Bacteroidales bacterium]MDY3103042.1 tRNA (N6-isopentenyl adenosine(37)-C2)-methylthiotransferase MiaB [Porphyromonas sp.]
MKSRKSDQIQKTIFIETYGCQMNVADSEVVAAIMETAGYELLNSPEEAQAILINTCSVRDNAEKKVLNRLEHYNQVRRKRGIPAIIGVLGCMAERVQKDLIEKHGADIVAGPDAYNDLPHLFASVEAGEQAINIDLSRTETYKEVIPLKLAGLHITGFVSIMRGCDNYCTYCIVPYTRGHERSREVESILREIDHMVELGYREVTLLGQNVNSYRREPTTPGGRPFDFADLLQAVAERAPKMRIRFTSPHPKDMSDKTLAVMARYPNICKQIHLPVQSGSNHILKQMKRGYTREWYLDRVQAIRKAMPECSIGTDMFCGFCGESEEDFQETLQLMREVGFDSAFMFKYSERPGTFAAKHLQDDVPEETKIRRLNEMIALQNELSLTSNRRDIGKQFEVLVEGTSKRSREELFGRTSQNKVVVFPKEKARIGQFITVEVLDATSATLLGKEVSPAQIKEATENNPSSHL